MSHKNSQNLPQKPADSHFTDGQWEAIHQYGHNILVSASAGSGKTTVLTNRIIEKLKKGIRIDQLVIVTFTDAATHEMKERIEKAIKTAVNQSTDASLRAHLQAQLTLLPQANISTIHSFCSRLIKQHFEQVHVDPAFRLMTDDTEILLMKERLLHQLKEDWYTKEPYKSVSRAYSAKRSDEKLENLLLRVYDFARSKENPLEWLGHLDEAYHHGQIEEASWYKDIVKPYVLDQLEDNVRVIQQGLEVLNGESDLAKPIALLEEDAQVYQGGVDLLQQESNYDQLVAYFKGASFGRWAAGTKDEGLKELAGIAKSYRDSAKESFTSLVSTWFARTSDLEEKRIQEAGSLVSTIGSMVSQFSDAYAKEKKRLKVLDYGDLEHLALEILAPLDQEGNRQPSPVSSYYRNYLDEVMVDEYQDLNRLQEAILQYLSNGSNMFMVGDVKQSIYAFRLADPSLFLEKYEAFAEDPSLGQRILLQENFRSRASVLDGVNLIFQQIMDKRVGEMAYDQDAMLVQGNKEAYPHEEQVDMTVLVYESQKEEAKAARDTEEEGAQEDIFDSTTQGEIHMVAQEIQGLMAKPFMVSQDGQERPIAYKDIVLLAPTKTHNLDIKHILDSHGIPSRVQEADAYFQRSEILTMLSLLKLIDNPHQDIPLAAVLRSPLVGLGENALAAIRINDRTSEYYEASLAFIRDFEAGQILSNDFHKGVYEKLKKFMDQLNQWRFLAARGSLVSLIWAIYEETMYLDYVAGLPNGPQRVANLHGLYQKAKEYEVNRFKGVFQFVRYIEKMQEREQDIAQVALNQADDNVVTVMTVHASKGLEFPVVFALDLSKPFNTTDQKGDYLFSDRYGLGTYAFDLEKKWKYKTLPFLAIKQEKRQKMLAEEMRKLYVALTRAKEKLYLVGHCKNQAAFWEGLSLVAQHRETLLPTARRAKASVTAFDWISMALVRNVQAKNDYLPAPYLPNDLRQSPARFHLEFYKAEDLVASQEEEANLNPKDMALKDYRGNPTFERLKQVVDFSYPYQAETQTTSYQAVSELKRLFEDVDLTSLPQLTTPQASAANRFVSDELPGPQFLRGEERVTAALIGSATHLLLQKLPLDKPVSQASLEQTLGDLIAKQLIKPQVAQGIKRTNLLRFFSSDFGTYLQQEAQRLKTEVPFSLIVPAQDLFPQVKDASKDILIHGIVDGYLEFEDGIILFDYKTDHVAPGRVGELIDRYKLQLKVYALALESATGKPVKQAMLCLLEAGQTIDLVPYF